MNIKNDSIDRLFEAMMSLRSIDEFYSFFEDLCTVKEILDMAQRLDTAFLLEKGMNYKNISESIGVSTATISRVSRCLNYGSGGYKTVMERLNEND